MLEIEKIIEKEGKIICKTNQGELKEGSIVVLDSNYKGDLNTFFLNTKNRYRVNDLLKDSIFGGVTVFLDGHLEEPIYYQYLNISKPIEFNVFKWKGYYILSDSVSQAELIWEESNLKAIEEDGLLFPRQLNRIKSEALYPSIISESDWENVLFELK